MSSPVLQVLIAVQAGQPSVVQAGADLARRLGADVHVVQAIDSVALTPVAAVPAPLPVDRVLARAGRSTDPEESARAALSQLQAEVAGTLDGLVWTAHVLDGPAVEKILALADEVGAYLLVVGASHHGLGATWSHLVNGSVVKGLERRSSRPVLLVPDASA